MELVLVDVEGVTAPLGRGFKRPHSAEICTLTLIKTVKSMEYKVLNSQS